MIAKPAAARSPLRAALAAFWAGFTQPSLFALFGMAIMFVVTAITVFVEVTPQKLAGPLGNYLARTHRDDEGSATKNAFVLADISRPVSTTPHLYVLGNSLIAQSLANGPKLDKALEAETHRPWSTYFMTTGSQGPLDEASLADYATIHQPGIVVLPMNFDRFESDPKEMMRYYRIARLGFRSELADSQVKEILKERPRRRTGIFLFDNRFFFLRNASMIALRLIWRSPAEQRIDNFVFKPTPGKLVTYKQEIVGSLRASYRHPQLATSLLEDTVKTIEARGSSVIFFQTPISKILLDDPADYHRFRIHLAKSEEMAKRLGGYYCKPPGDAVLPTHLFSDYYHLANPVWQDKMRRTLARCAAEVQRERTAS